LLRAVTCRLLVRVCCVWRGIVLCLLCLLCLCGLRLVR